jgi:hypothetical protein
VEDLNINSLIVIKQLPIIEQMLEELSKDIDLKIETAKNMIPENADEVLKYTKSARAELNKDFAELEERRKSVKKEIMKPYEDFEAIYKEKISDKFKSADKLFKDQINESESILKSEKAKKVEKYFDEYCLANDIKGISFSEANIAVNLSGSIKSYNDKVKAFIDKIKQDFEVINTSKDEKTKLEILREYKKDFNLSNAVLTVDRKNAELAQLAQEQGKEVEVIAAPETDEVYEMTFTVSGTRTQLKALKEYLIKNKLI